MRNATTTADFFEHIYRQAPDPWNFAASDYEQADTEASSMPLAVSDMYARSNPDARSESSLLYSRPFVIALKRLIFRRRLSIVRVSAVES